jgi:hypothetical protein
LTLSSGVVFGCFASGEMQDWGRRPAQIQSFVDANAVLMETEME